MRIGRKCGGYGRNFAAVKIEMDMEFTGESIGSVVLALVALVVEYLCVLLAVLVDLRSGVVRARREKRPRTSRGYRRTVEKASRYYMVLFALTIVDVMWMMSALLLRESMGWQLPVFPFVTTVGAVGLSLIEMKSVMENTHSRKELTDAVRAVNELLDDPDVAELVRKIRR